jgi:N-acetylglucosamine-6-phosphate deacetylase
MGVNGFVDLQVNGYRGMDFSRSGLTIDAVAAVARDLALGAPRPSARRW